MKPEKSFGEIWSELTQEQSEYLKGYINRQRIDAINIHEKISTKQKEKLEADKAELLEALENVSTCIRKMKVTTEYERQQLIEIESLIQKHKQ